MSTILRRLSPQPIRVEKRADGSPMISGTAAVFGQKSRKMFFFREVIERGALDEADMSEVFCYWMHERNQILGRTPDTLRLKLDERGLHFENDPPDTQLGRDTVHLMERGDVRSASIGFIVARDGDKWSIDEDETELRTITRIAKVVDTSPVDIGQYDGATSELRAQMNEDEARRSYEYHTGKRFDAAALRAANLRLADIRLNELRRSQRP